MTGASTAQPRKGFIVRQRKTKWQVALAVLTLGATVFLVSERQTHAVTNVTISSPTLFSTLDASDGSTDGVFTVSGDLTITNGGAITCDDTGGGSACPIRIAFRYASDSKQLRLRAYGQELTP